MDQEDLPSQQADAPGTRLPQEEQQPEERQPADQHVPSLQQPEAELPGQQQLTLLPERAIVGSQGQGEQQPSAAEAAAAPQEAQPAAAQPATEHAQPACQLAAEPRPQPPQQPTTAEPAAVEPKLDLQAEEAKEDEEVAADALFGLAAAAATSPTAADDGAAGGWPRAPWPPSGEDRGQLPALRRALEQEEQEPQGVLSPRKRPRKPNKTLAMFAEFTDDETDGEEDRTGGGYRRPVKRGGGRNGGRGRGRGGWGYPGLGQPGYRDGHRESSTADSRDMSWQAATAAAAAQVQAHQHPNVGGGGARPLMAAQASPAPLPDMLRQPLKRCAMHAYIAHYIQHHEQQAGQPGGGQAMPQQVPLSLLHQAVPQMALPAQPPAAAQQQALTAGLPAQLAALLPALGNAGGLAALAPLLQSSGAGATLAALAAAGRGLGGAGNMGALLQQLLQKQQQQPQQQQLSALGGHLTGLPPHLASALGAASGAASGGGQQQQQQPRAAPSSLQQLAPQLAGLQQALSAAGMPRGLLGQAFDAQQVHAQQQAHLSQPQQQQQQQQPALGGLGTSGRISDVLGQLLALQRQFQQQTGALPRVPMSAGPETVPGQPSGPALPTVSKLPSQPPHHQQQPAAPQQRQPAAPQHQHQLQERQRQQQAVGPPQAALPQPSQVQPGHGLGQASTLPSTAPQHQHNQQQLAQERGVPADGPAGGLFPPGGLPDLQRLLEAGKAAGLAGGDAATALQSLLRTVGGQPQQLLQLLQQHQQRQQTSTPQAALSAPVADEPPAEELRQQPDESKEAETAAAEGAGVGDSLEVAVTAAHDGKEGLQQTNDAATSPASRGKGEAEVLGAQQQTADAPAKASPSAGSPTQPNGLPVSATHEPQAPGSATSPTPDAAGPLRQQPGGSEQPVHAAQPLDRKQQLAGVLEQLRAQLQQHPNAQQLLLQQAGRGGMLQQLMALSQQQQQQPTAPHLPQQQEEPQRQQQPPASAAATGPPAAGRDAQESAGEQEGQAQPPRQLPAHLMALLASFPNAEAMLVASGMQKPPGNSGQR